MRLLWHTSFHDGPISGMCIYEDRPHWFNLAFDDKGRVFDIIYLDDDQIAAEEERNALFRQHVGEHCNYDENNKRDGGSLRPREEWQKFYALPPLERDYVSIVATVSEDELLDMSTTNG